MTRRLAPVDVVSVAFVVPLQGPTGLYGPSCLACGELAVEQLNASTGIAGRQVTGRTHRDHQVSPWHIAYAEGTVERADDLKAAFERARKEVVENGRVALVDVITQVL